MSGTDNLLYVKNLRVSFRTGKQSCFEAVKGISFTVPDNKTVALVGESGSGKSVSALAVMGLLPSGNAVIDAGSDILYNGKSLLKMNPEERRRLCGLDLHDLSGTDVVFESRFYGGIPDWRSAASAQGNGFSAGENASH